MLTSILASIALRILSHLGDDSVAAAPADPAFAEPVVIAHDTAEGETLLGGTRTALDTQLSETDRRRLGKKVLSKSRVEIVRAELPGDADAVVTVNVELRRKDPTNPVRFISGVFTLDATGTLAHVIVAPKMRAERFDLVGIGDTDGDAHDDLLLNVTGDNTSSQRVVTWSEGAPVSTSR
jgi:hypothetical protein